MRVRLYKKTKDNLSYFQILTDDGQAVLNSQGYADKDDRNNGVRSVVANANNAARYERQTSDDGKNFFLLKAGNGQEIARSVDFDDAASMEAALSACIAEIPTLTGMEDGDGQPKEAPAAAPPAADPNPYDGERGDDNYRPLAFYQERIKGVENGFDSFATDEGQFYFTLNQGGNIVLISEAYTSADGRNNGTAAVTRNLPNPDRYQRREHPNGKSYFNLLAGNNQQIATSVWFDSEGEMNAVIDALQRGLFGGTEEVVLKEAGAGITGDVEGMAGYRAAVDIDAPPPPKEKVAKEKKKKKPSAPKEKSADEKVYLKSGTYLFNDVSWQTMRSANGKHYFSFRTAEGKSLMLSTNVQGFATEAEVDAQVQRVIELGPYEGNYHGKTTTNGKYYFYLNDIDGKPVAKSFFYDTTEEMQDAIGLLIGRAKVAAAAAPTAIETPAGIHDDYLACERYNGEPAFHRFFNGDDENWYFGYNDAAGKTLLRSEGYTTEKARDNGIESVTKNAPLEERWVTGNDGSEYYYALRAGNNQEIARSCYFADEAGMLAGLAAAKDAFTPKVEKDPEPAPRIVDDYLPCEAYAGMEGYHTFEHEGEYYFSYNDIAGNVILRSEGYKSIAARDNGIESVKKNSPIEERWV
nr:YegP family protein [Saprospiraceae bacterium]